jgi:hypothetical protein
VLRRNHRIIRPDNIGPRHNHPSFRIHRHRRIVLIKITLTVDYKFITARVGFTHDPVTAQILSH